MDEMVRTLKGLNSLSLDTKINEKVGKVIDEIDVTKIVATDTFQSMLATTLACKAVGIEFHNN